MCSPQKRSKRANKRPSSPLVGVVEASATNSLPLDRSVEKSTTATVKQLDASHSNSCRRNAVEAREATAREAVPGNWNFNKTANVSSHTCKTEGERYREAHFEPADSESYQQSALSGAKTLFKEARKVEKKAKEKRKHKGDLLPEKNDEHQETPARKKSRKGCFSCCPRTGMISQEGITAVAALLRSEVQQPYAPGGDRFPWEFHSPPGKPETEGAVRTVISDATTSKRQQKSGPFTREEHRRLKEAIEQYFKAKAWDPNDGWGKLFALNCGGGRISKSRAAEQAAHWAAIRVCLPLRALSSIQRHALRRVYPWKRGPWTLAEAEKLVDLVSKHGPQWTLLSNEYFKRAPNYLHLKYKELEPLILQQKPLRRRRNSLIWTKEDDVELLANIKLATGVPLPYRAIPWSVIQQRMPRYSTYQLMARYRERLFPLIIRGQGGAMSAKVLFRQYIRYLYNGIQAGIIKDSSEVEVRRVVPFWFGAAFTGQFSRYLRSSCPASISDTSFAEQVHFIYKQAGCEKAEHRDLAALASSLEVLRRLNGSSLNSADDKNNNTGNATNRYGNTNPQLSDFARSLFSSLDADEVASAASKLHVGLPLSVSIESAAAVMPLGAANTAPEMYPLYLSQATRRNLAAAEGPSTVDDDDGDTNTEGIVDRLDVFLQRKRRAMQKKAYRIDGKLFPVAKHPWLLTMNRSTTPTLGPPNLSSTRTATSEFSRSGC